MRRFGLLVALGLLAVAAPVSAEAADGGVYVALGDSYTSGPGILPIHGRPLGCTRADAAYPVLVAKSVVPVVFRESHCSGAVTRNMTEPQIPTLIGGEEAITKLAGTNPPQFDALSADTTLVTVGIGGNDAGLVGVAYACVAAGLLRPQGSPCRDSYAKDGQDAAMAGIDAIAPRLAAVYRGIHERAPRARVLAVGYPAAMPLDGRTCFPLLPFADGDVAWFGALLARINAVVEREARANDAEYVDVSGASIGADVCQPPGGAGYTALLPTSGLSIPVHPNEIGMQIAARAVLAQLREPQPTGLRLDDAAQRRRTIVVNGAVSPRYAGTVTVSFRARGTTVTRRVKPVGTRWRTVIRVRRAVALRTVVRATAAQDTTTARLRRR